MTDSELEAMQAERADESGPREGLEVYDPERSSSAWLWTDTPEEVEQ